MNFLKKKELFEICNNKGIKYKKSYNKAKLIELINQYNMSNLPDETPNKISKSKIITVSPIIETKLNTTITEDYMKYDDDTELIKSELNKYIIKKTGSKLNDIEKGRILEIHQNFKNEYNFNNIKMICGNWKINRLEFQNVFIFGKNNKNVIDFNKFANSHVIGILGANSIGKSSIINILLYTLFDTIGPGFKNYNILNNEAKQFYVSAEFECNNNKYVIKKVGRHSVTEKKTSVIINASLEKNGVEILDNKSQIDKEIKKLIGEHENFLLMNLYSNTINKNIFTTTNAGIMDNLNKLFKLDNYKLIANTVKKNIKEINSDINILEGELNILSEKVTYGKIRCDDGNIDDSINIDDIKYKVNKLNREIDTLNSSENKLEAEKKDLNDKLDIMKDLLNKLNKKYHPEFANMEVDISGLSRKYEHKDLKKMEKDLVNNKGLLNGYLEKINNCDYQDLNIKHIVDWKNYLINLEKIMEKYSDYVGKKFNINKLEKNLEIVKNKTDPDLTSEKIRKLLNDSKIDNDVKSSTIKKDIDQVSFELNAIGKNVEVENNVNIDLLYVKILKDGLGMDKNKNAGGVSGDIEKLKNNKKNPGIFHEDLNLDPKYHNGLLIEKILKLENKLKEINDTKKISDENIDRLVSVLNKKSPVIEKTKIEIISILKNVKIIQNKSTLLKKCMNELAYFKDNLKKRNDNEEYNKIVENNAKIDEQIYKLEKVKLKYDFLKKYDELCKLKKKYELAYNTEQLTYFDKIDTLIAKIKYEKNRKMKLWVTKVIKYSDEINILEEQIEIEKKQMIKDNMEVAGKIREYEEKNNELSSQIKIIIRKLLSTNKTKYELTLKRDLLNKQVDEYIEYNDVISKKKVKLEQALYIIKILDVYKNLIADKCIPLLLLKTKVNLIENYVNNFMNEISADLSMNIIIQDNAGKIQFDIIKYNKKLSYYQCSGFERFILQIAMKRALNKFSFVRQSSIFMIDEGMNCIDKFNWKKLPLIIELLRRDYLMIILISQVDNLENIVEEKINIESNGGSLVTPFNI